MSAGGRDGCEPQGCVGGCLWGLPSPAPLHAPLERTPRGAGPAARAPGPCSRGGAAQQAALWTGNPRASQLLFIAGEVLAGPAGAAPRSSELWGGQGLLQGDPGPPAHCSGPPGPPLPSASTSAAESRLCGPSVHSTCFAAAPPRGGEGGGGGEPCRLSSLPPTSEAARRLWGAALEPSISCFTSSRPKCHFLRHVLWGPRGCGAEGPALKVLSRWGAILARQAFSGTFCSE